MNSRRYPILLVWLFLACNLIGCGKSSESVVEPKAVEDSAAEPVELASGERTGHDGRIDDRIEAVVSLWDDDDGRASQGILVVDRQDKLHRLTDWAFSWGSRGIDELPAVEACVPFPLLSPDQKKQIAQRAKTAGRKTSYAYITEYVPFSSIDGIVFLSGASFDKRGNAVLLLRNGRRERIPTESMRVKGQEDLGPLGLSDYSADDEDIKGIRFFRTAVDPSDSVVSNRAPAMVPAVITDRAGGSHQVDDIYTYYTTSNCTYAIHFPCDCGKTGHLSTEFLFSSGNNDITLGHYMMSSMCFESWNDEKDDGWWVDVVLKSGPSHRLLYRTRTIVGVMGNRYLSFPEDVVHRITFGDPKAAPRAAQEEPGRELAMPEAEDYASPATDSWETGGSLRRQPGWNKDIVARERFLCLPERTSTGELTEFQEIAKIYVQSPGDCQMSLYAAAAPRIATPPSRRSSETSYGDQGAMEIEYDMSRSMHDSGATESDYGDQGAMEIEHDMSRSMHDSGATESELEYHVAGYHKQQYQSEPGTTVTVDTVKLHPVMLAVGRTPEFHLKAENYDGGPKRRWNVIKVHSEVMAGRSSTDAIIGTFELDGHSLRFRWGHQENAAGGKRLPIEFCLLGIAVGGETESCFLSRPQSVEDSKLHFAETDDRHNLPAVVGEVGASHQLGVDFVFRGFPGEIEPVICLLPGQQETRYIELDSDHGIGDVAIAVKLDCNDEQPPSLAFTTFVYVRGIQRTPAGKISVILSDLAGLELHQAKSRIQDSWPAGEKQLQSTVIFQDVDDLQQDAMRHHSRIRRECKEVRKGLVKASSVVSRSRSLNKALRYEAKGLISGMREDIKGREEFADKASQEIPAWRDEMKTRLEELRNTSRISYAVYIVVGGRKVDLVRSESFSGS